MKSFLSLFVSNLTLSLPPTLHTARVTILRHKCKWNNGISLETLWLPPYLRKKFLPSLSTGPYFKNNLYFLLFYSLPCQKLSKIRRADILENHSTFFPLGLSKCSLPKMLFPLLLIPLTQLLLPLLTLLCINTAGVLPPSCGGVDWSPPKPYLHSDHQNVNFSWT